MDDQEFRNLLDLFPLVRSRDYRADLDSLKQSTSQSIAEREVSEWHDAPSVIEPKDLQDRKTDHQDEFWENLKAAAEKKVGEVEAERFCKAFEKLHKKLVYEELNPDAAKRYLLNS